MKSYIFGMIPFFCVSFIMLEKIQGGNAGWRGTKMWNISFEHGYVKRFGATDELIARFVQDWNAALSV